MEHFGTITEISRDGFQTAIRALTPALLPYSPEGLNRLPVRIGYKRHYFSFDCPIRSLTRNNETARDEITLALEFPGEVRRNTDRPLRIRPMKTVRVSLPSYSLSALRHETETFFRFGDKHSLLREIDEQILSGEEFSLQDAQSRIEDELLNLSGCNRRTAIPGVSCYRFVTRDTDERRILDKTKELWILDTQRSGIPVKDKEHYAKKGIGSLVLCLVTSQLLQKDAFLALTRAMGQRGISQTEKEYIQALARRLCLALGMNKTISFTLRDIGEDGLSLSDPSGLLALLPPETLLRDLTLSLHPEESLRFHAALVRSSSDLRALRTGYPEFSDRLKVRRFIESTLRLKKLSGKIF